MNRQLQIHMLTLCLLVLLAVSCKQDDCGSPAGYSSEMIVFTSPYTLTRSDALRYGSFRSGDKVGVLGFCKAENMGEDYSSSPWNTKKVFCIPEVFYNQQLTYGEAGLWTYQWNEDGHVDYLHPWYNDPEYTYSFFAYYPYAKIADDGSGTIHNQNEVSMGTVRISGKEVKGDPTITYTMPFEGSRELDWQLVPDLMLAYKIDHKMNDGPVRLNFRHLLCAFEFKVNNYNLEKVKISSLKVSGKDFYKEVTVKGQQSGYDIGTGRYSGTFDVLSTYNEKGFVCPPGEKREGSDEVIPATVSITTDGSVDPEGDPVDLLFIPNEHGKLTADDNESLNLIVTVDGYQQNVSMNLKDATFKAGVRSIFSINIVGNDIYLQVETDGNWNDGGDSDISFE